MAALLFVAVIIGVGIRCDEIRDKTMYSVFACDASEVHGGPIYAGTRVD
jgi:hypothetical protein